jgi:hypothetical protein
MAKKPHFASSVERLAEGSNIPAACGKVIPSAKFIAFADSQWIGLDLLSVQSQMSGCRKCLEEMAKITTTEKRYEYALVTGEETMRDSQE